jgi:hypothetical protein
LATPPRRQARKGYAEKTFEFGTVLTNGGIGHGFDTSDNSGSLAIGRGAQMAPQQKLGIRT